EPPRSGLQSEACDRHRRCSAPDGGHAGLRPRLKSSCFSARPSKSENRKLPAGQPSADNASAFFTQPPPIAEIQTGILPAIRRKPDPLRRRSPLRPPSARSECVADADRYAAAVGGRPPCTRLAQASRRRYHDNAADSTSS